MENSSAIIFDISSDEEAGFGDAWKGDGYGWNEFGDREDQDWLSKLLGQVDGNKDGDSDDVVFVSEVFPSSNKSKLQGQKTSSAKIVDDDDDDCVVLDGDPEKPSGTVENGRADNHDNDDGDSDDVEIVGEKGEVACRDFPHPRHLCAKFPFISTSHSVHCGQCHCYVCDSLAPCAHWGTGISDRDHCHASDKEEHWKAERKSMTKRDKPATVLPSTINSYFSAGLHHIPRAPGVAQQPHNSSMQNQGLRTITSQPCSISSNTHNVASQGKNHPSGCVLPGYKRQQHLVAQQLHRTCHSNVTSRVSNPGKRGPQFISPCVGFKRSGFTEASPNKRCGYDKNYSQLSRDPSIKRCHALPHPALNCHSTSNERNVGRRAANVVPHLKPSRPPSMNVRHANYTSSQPQARSQPYLSCPNRDPITYPPQMPSQPCLRNSFVSTAPLQSEITSQPNLGEFDNVILSGLDAVFQANFTTPSETLASNQLKRSNLCENQLHSQSVISSHGNTFENRFYQPQVDSNRKSFLIDDVQNNFRHGIVDTSLTDFGVNWDASLSHGSAQIPAEIPQPQTAASAYNSQIQNMARDAYHQKIAAADTDKMLHVENNDVHIPGCTNPDSFDFDFENWTFDGQSSAGGLDVLESSFLNIFSPEPACTDAGALFNF